MPANTTTINGKVLAPDNTGCNGTVLVQLVDSNDKPTTGYADDAGTKHRIVSAQQFPIVAGVITGFALIPNAEITPANTRYIATYSISYPVGIPRRKDRLNVPVAPDPCNLGDISTSV